MTPRHEPLLCLWADHAPQPARIAAWRARIPAEAEIVLAGPVACDGAAWADCAGDPLGALQAVARAHPQRDVVFADLDAALPPDGWRRLLDAAAAHPRIGVLSTLGSAVAALDAMPDSDPGDRGDGLCRAYGEHAVFSTTLWSPGLSFWRSTALREAARVQAGGLPESVSGGVIGDMHVPSPRIAGFPDTAPLPIRALRERLHALVDAPGWHPAGRPVVLHLLHGWGGGVERFVRDLMQADDERAHLALVARSDPATRMHGIALALHHDLDAPPLRSWTLARPIADTAVHSPEYQAILDDALSQWGIGAALVSSLIGHGIDALRTSLPPAVCTHDYYPLWPLLHADFSADADWSDAALRAALAKRDPESPFAIHDADHWIALRAGRDSAVARWPSRAGR